MRQEKPIYPVGRRITRFREQKGITVNKLANMAGLSQSHLRDIELEQKNPSVETVYIICQALGISMKDFFDEDTSEQILSDPLLQRIYQLNLKQKETLLAFLDTVK